MTECKDMGRIHMNEDTVQWQASANMVLRSGKPSWDANYLLKMDFVLQSLVELVNLEALT